MNVAAYVRVSTDGQTKEDKFGIAAQKKAIKDYCEANGHTIAEWFVEEGKSGAKEDRPEFDKIVFGWEVMNPPLEAVVVAKSDRIARDINIYYYYKHELLKKNMKLISVSEDFGAMGQFATLLEAFVVTIAEMERANITKRTAGGRAVKANRGGYSGGHAPFGYKPMGRQLVIDEEKAEVVRRIFKMRKDGVSINRIATTLYDERVPTNSPGGHWFASTIKTILDNEKTYRGFYKYGKMEDWVRGQHEPILKDDD